MPTWVKHLSTSESVHRFAGKLIMQKSAAILSNANYLIGPDSLLMHIENGLNIPCSIIFGFSCPVDCFGYSENINLATAPECSPCWIHDGHQKCEQEIKCMNSISKRLVIDAFTSLLKNSPEINQN